MSLSDELPKRLAEIVDDFKLCEGREKLDLLLQYAESLPQLPEWLTAQKGKMEAVPECMTPVSVFSRLENGAMEFYFDVPEESPTVRGYAAIMAIGLHSSTPEQVLKIPSDFYLQMGLQDVLTAQRLNGMSAIIGHVKRLAVENMKVGS